MNRIMVGLSAIAMIAGRQILIGQGQRFEHDPFIDQSDTGELIHVLPAPACIRSPHDTDPTFAPPSSDTAVFAPSYGSGDLINHGGHQIPNASFMAIYWNGSVANSTETSMLNNIQYPTLESQMSAFVQKFPDQADWSGASTDDYTIIQQYGATDHIANSLYPRTDLVDTQSTAKMIKDSAIQTYLKSLFNASRVVVDENTIYGIYFPPGMTVSLQGTSCSSFCGYHSTFIYRGLNIKYAVFPYLNCTACKLNTLTVADMMTIVTSHEIREAVTDPQLNAWYDRSGYEADDKCAWHNLYQTTTGGFWVQPEYSNGGTVTASGFTATYPLHGCVVPTLNAPKPH